ncbi:hypothetical protein GGX14DRAFT_387974 [Mycena pura]|uniref:Uncharacterized protein n=1 Tax=Mycena pura TaxID=153505 RepID=A0AAD6VVC7_9AGAR|nr:hypothetical protein GGX14DRAFT_387974 [Mycena pura]
MAVEQAVQPTQLYRTSFHNSGPMPAYRYIPPAQKDLLVTVKENTSHTFGLMVVVVELRGCGAGEKHLPAPPPSHLSRARILRHPITSVDIPEEQLKMTTK